MAIGSISCSGDYALEMSQMAQAQQLSQIARPDSAPAELATPALQPIDISAQEGVATAVDLYV